MEDSIASAWAPGAEILVTSHTRAWDEHQVRRIVSVAISDPGFVLIRLDAPIVVPTTVVEHPVFAAEVALLSRNILLKSNDNSLMGGHFEIRRTLSGPQQVIGVEIAGFGQPGMDGRFPLHIFYTPSIDGSIIAKNTVRQSKQRCIVLRGANSFIVEDNIGFDVMGHCFMTTDGIETNNYFERNLGAFIQATESLLAGEHDNEPSVFWIASPTNHYRSNVAAGSEGSGFWFYPQLRGLGETSFPERNPSSAELLLFSNNVAHSSSNIAVNMLYFFKMLCADTFSQIRTSRPGFMPPSLATLDKAKVYKNRNSGLVLHRCSNIIIANSFFADNSRGIDIDRSAGIFVRNTTIIGKSASYEELLLRQSGVEDVCGNRRLIGLDLHSWKVEEDFGGAFFRDLHFQGFENILCGQSNSIYMDPLVCFADIAC